MSQSQWIWVTGASTGIGEALARRLLQNGHNVVISARSADKLESLAQAFPARCHALPVDLTDREALSQVSDRLKTITHHLDSVVINAGTCEYIDVKHFEAAPFAPVMNINVVGSANTVELALPFLVEAETAAEHIARGMARRQRIVQFPWQLVWTMRLISWLPLGWKTALLKKMVKD